MLLGISSLSSSIVVLQPLMMQKLIDEAFVLKDMQSLYFWATIIIILGIIGIALSSFVQYFYTSVSTKILFNLRLDIFGISFFKNKPFFQKYKIGDLLSRLQGDIAEIQRFGTDSIFALTSALLGMIGSLVVMFSFNPTLTLFSLLLLPLEFMILRPLYPKMHKKTIELREANASLGSFLIESLRYALFFRSFNWVKQRTKELSTIQDENQNKILSQTKLNIIFSQVPVAFGLLGRAFLVIWGGVEVVNGQMLIGQFIAFLTYFGIILSPIQTVLGVLNNLPRVEASFDRLSIFLQTSQNKSKQQILDQKPDIKFENVHFNYKNAPPLLININIHIPYGEKVVLLGENGSGKSTLFDLLLNFLKPTCGEIKIANLPLHSISNQSLYKTIGLVEQNPIILGMSLRDNLLLAKEDASDEELISTLKQVELFDWFSGLELGLATKLSESGLSLSGGQKQRLAIARMILRKPSIILLDEHTASLDKNFSTEIENLIDRVFKNHTRIIVSHKTNFTNATIYTINNQTLHKVITNE